MTLRSKRNALFGLLLAPLAMGLAACGDSGSIGDGSGSRIENIAPPAGTNWSEVVEKTEEGGYRMGNPDAPIKLVEFASLTCPHCKHFTEEGGAELRDEFVASGRVSWEFRNFVMNPLDLTMAMLVRCGTPESFFALTEQTFASQADIVETWSSAGEQRLNQAGNLPPEARYKAFADISGLTEFFAARGIAADQATACLADTAGAEAMVKATSEQAAQYEVSGTPAFLINGQKTDVNTWPEIKTRLENLGAR